MDALEDGKETKAFVSGQTLHYTLGIETWFLKRNLSSEAHFGPMGFQQLEVIFKTFYDLLKNFIHFENILNLQK